MFLLVPACSAGHNTSVDPAVQNCGFHKNFSCEEKPLLGMHTKERFFMVLKRRYER